MLDPLSGKSKTEPLQPPEEHKPLQQINRDEPRPQGSEAERAQPRVATPLLEISLHKSHFWSRSLLKRHQMRFFAGLLLISLTLVVAVLTERIHALPFSATPTRAIHPQRAIPTPSRSWQSWPQVLNDALQDTDYNQDWVVAQDAQATSSDALCTFSSLSHTYQLASLGMNYCAYGDSHLHPWIDLASSIEVSIRKGDWGGPLVRLREGNYYYFNVSIHGTYELTLHQSIDGGQDTMLARGTSAAIHQGLDQWNTLLVVAQATSFQLWINGQYR